jgi:uncharacterized membrane protein
LLGLLVLGAPLAFAFGQWGRVSARVAREARAMVPTVGVVGILFGLFTSFTSADINQRANSLQLAVERELSAARSLVNITTGVGPVANPIRAALLEYLQTVETTERAWLEGGARGTAPGDAPVYSLVLVTTVFAEHAKAESVIKTLMMSRVDELVNARTERITRTTRRADQPLWIALVLMAVVTQVAGAVALSGARLQAATFLASYTVVAVLALGYLAWADRLLGGSRVPDQAAAFGALRSEAQ